MWRRQWHPTPVLLPGKSHEQRSLVGCHPWGHKESDMTEWLHFRFSLSCIGEASGNPLQCSCLENPRDGGVWWAAIHGVTKSRTQLKRLSSSSSRTSLVVQWLRPSVSNAGGLGSIPDRKRRSHMLYSMIEKTKYYLNTSRIFFCLLLSYCWQISSPCFSIQVIFKKIGSVNSFSPTIYL